MNPQELLAILGQMGIPPEQRQAMLQYIMASGQPAMDPFIGASEYDVKDANKWVDYGRDVNSLMADPMTAANAGMDAFGGANEIGFQAFDPVMEPPKAVAGPDRQLLDRYLARPTDDIGGWIADQIANQGATAFEVTGQLQQILNHGPWDDPELEARRAQLAQMVPSYTDELSGQTRWDYSGIETLAQKLEEQAVATPTPGSFQDAQGNWWTQESKDSPMTEWYRKQGLPLPTQQYTLSDFTQEGADAQQKADLLTQMYANQAPVREAMDTRMQQAYQALLDTRERARQVEQQQAAATATPKALSPNPAEYAAFLQQQRGANMGPSNAPQNELDAQWRAAMDKRNTERAQVGLGPQQIIPGDSPPPVPPMATAPTGGNDYLQTGGSFLDPLTNPAGWAHDQQMRQRAQQADQTDPNRTQTAMRNYLDTARARSSMDQAGLDAWKAQQQAEGKVFMEYDPATKRYKRGQDKGILQGRLNYGVARAQGRTPLQDALRARAMAAFMMGG